jgi:hypothetical protein
MLTITNDSGEFLVEVLQLSEMCGPASIAQTSYRESHGSRELCQKVVAERKAIRQFEQSAIAELSSSPAKPEATLLPRLEFCYFAGCASLDSDPESIVSPVREMV